MQKSSRAATCQALSRRNSSSYHPLVRPDVLHFAQFPARIFKTGRLPASSASFIFSLLRFQMVFAACDRNPYTGG